MMFFVLAACATEPAAIPDETALAARPAAARDFRFHVAPDSTADGFAEMKGNDATMNCGGRAPGAHIVSSASDTVADFYACGHNGAVDGRDAGKVATQAGQQDEDWAKTRTMWSLERAGNAADQIDSMRASGAVDGATRYSTFRETYPAGVTATLTPSAYNMIFQFKQYQGGAPSMSATMDAERGNLDLNCGSKKLAIHPLADVVGHTVTYRIGVRWSATDGATWVKYKIDDGAWTDAAGTGHDDAFVDCDGGNLQADAAVGGVAGSFLAVGVYRAAWNAGQGLANCNYGDGHIGDCATNDHTTHVTSSCWHMESSRTALAAWGC